MTYAEGVLPAKTKELIALACAHITQCPYCIDGHSQRARKPGCTEAEVAEAICVAIAIRAGATGTRTLTSRRLPSTSCHGPPCGSLPVWLRATAAPGKGRAGCTVSLMQCIDKEQPSDYRCFSRAGGGERLAQRELSQDRQGI